MFRRLRRPWWFVVVVTVVFGVGIGMVWELELDLM